MNSALYTGWVRHRRLAPRGHAFRFPLFMALLDLDELPTLFRGRWLWGAERRRPASFRRRDHFGDPARPLADCVRELVERETGVRPAGPVRLLTHLRYFGYVFNPVSFFYCYSTGGERLEAVVAEVNNTPWGERHCYVLPVAGGEGANGVLRLTPKRMHVSPFMPMGLDYEWRLAVPAARLAVHMRLLGRDGEVFNATLSLQRRPFAARAMAATLLRFPLMTLQVMAGIHWQALRLWLKGVPVHTHPAKSA
jgi:uncharacterized protein